MEQREQLEQHEAEQQMSFPTKVVLIGFFGGLIWSLVGYFAFYFNFIRVGPALVFMPWAFGGWKETHLGQWLGVLVIAILSIGVAFLYKAILQKVLSVWAGLGFGLILWGLVFYVLNPFFPGLKSVQNLDSNTIVTSICLYLLYGVFIGYSVSYEYAEQHHGLSDNQEDPKED
ncbi:YqhR family membrane protein [Alkalihalophilus lindianensis]|uniref:YqhR family membrane protein n=1 Tax=Alkalihalophilus lindianensis TaxID=1630542 RepID=A0ABU3XB72_9BACI|nr:YqhR family membrane protein [Alkalihalophilus lindianensis]MDV2685131.1 YqhR family membrane protein [Alkalihalophilus lindianensis]